VFERRLEVLVHVYQQQLATRIMMLDCIRRS
jgi:hypothetical protein